MDRISVVKEEGREESESEKGASGLRPNFDLVGSGWGVARGDGSDVSMFLYFARSSST